MHSLIRRGPLRRLCKAWLPFAGTYSFVCVSLVQCVFAIRIYALYRAKKVILIVFGLFLAGELALMAFFINHTTALPNPPGVTGCAGGGAFGSRGAAAFWGPSVLFDVVVFAMTVYKSYVTIKHSRSFGVLGILLRDGSLYFAVIFFVNMVNIFTLIFAPLDLIAVNANLATTLPVVITTRLILNLKATRVDVVSDYPSSQRTAFRAPGSHAHGSEWFPANQSNESATLWSFNAILDVLGVSDTSLRTKPTLQGSDPQAHELVVMDLTANPTKLLP